MIINPEFHKYLWLKISPMRLAVVPVIIAILIYTFNEGNLVDWRSVVFWPAVSMYCLVVFLWGNYEAASSTAKDVGMNTWDFQKMSAITPLELLIGRLFGPTSYVWYIGGILLFLIYISYDVSTETVIGGDFSSPVNPILYLILSGVMGHAVAMLVGVNGLRNTKKTGYFLAFILGAITSYQVMSLTIGSDFLGSSLLMGASVSWHNMAIGTHEFVMGSLVFFLFWVLTAIYRLFREVLQYKNSPIVLLAFLVTLCFYAIGFVGDGLSLIVGERLILLKVCVCFMVIFPVTYILALTEGFNISKYTRWIYALKGKEWKRAFENTPGWCGCLLLLIPAYAYIAFGMQGVETDIAKISEAFGFGRMYTISASSVSVLMLFMVRDALVCHAISFGTSKHKTFLIMLYFVMLHFVLASFFAAISTSLGAAVAISITLFSSADSGGASVALFPVVVQCALAGAYLVHVLRKSLDAKS